MGASTTGHRAGSCLDACSFELLRNLTNKVSFTLERELHAGGNVHQRSLGGWEGYANRVEVTY